MRKRKIEVVINDKIQKNYRYFLTEQEGKNFDKNFKPELTPKEMLSLGVFGGRYLRDSINEFPDSWFKNAKLHPKCIPGHSKDLNFFKVNASMPLSFWKEKSWINKDDPRGWFQWYCRYYMGRRHIDDNRQIKRWRAISRHISQIRNNCKEGDLSCRRGQRQAVLHWAYDSRKI